MRKDYILFTILFYLTFAFLFSGCGNDKSKKERPVSDATNGVSGEIIVFHAGSLSVPFKKITSAFNKEYPEVKVVLEAAGSVACARKITDLDRNCDVFASADYNVINKMLIPEYANWNIKFVSNEMAIVYTEKSKYQNEINKDNWTDILLKEDIYYGRSDPNSDPCGYRSVLTLKLAEKFYSKPSLVERFLAKDLNFIRPKEVDLIALLETNSLDYIFLYRSVAEQHGLKYLILPDQINLKNPDFSDYYSTVSVDIKGKKPGETIAQTGEPMVYGITIPNNALNSKTAETFVNFVLSNDKGLKIMEKNGQPSVIPAESKTYNYIPAQLKQFVKE